MHRLGGNYAEVRMKRLIIRKQEVDKLGKGKVDKIKRKNGTVRKKINIFKLRRQGRRKKEI